jgi:hypothetical protein
VTESTAPTTIVIAAIAQSPSDQSQRLALTPTYVTRRITPNAASLVQAAMKPVIGVGAPW